MKLVFIIAICFNLHSCTKPFEEITWDLSGHSPMLVVDGSVTNLFENQGVKLTLSSPYFSTENPLSVHGATVKISEGNNNYNLTESTQNDGWYYSDEPFAGEPGKTYDLHIVLSEDINGQKEYSAYSTMPEGLDIDSIYCEIYALPEIPGLEESSDIEKDTTILQVVFFGQEPESLGNYYCAKIFKNDKPLFSNIKSNLFIDDSQRNGEYINLITCVKNVADQDNISFQLLSISRDYFNYIDAISKIDMTGDIYSPQGPPANAIGNVNNALGFFIATYVSTRESIAVDMR